MNIDWGSAALGLCCGGVAVGAVLLGVFLFFFHDFQVFK